MFNKIDSAIYDKCMKLAKDAGEKFCKDKVFTESEICYSALEWAKAWEAYSKGKITEEDIKDYFALGYVPKYSIAYDMAHTFEYNKIGISIPKLKSLKYYHIREIS